MTAFSDLLFSLFAATVGTFGAAFIPCQTENFLLWKVPVTVGDAVGTACGIPSGLASALIGLTFGTAICFSLMLYRKVFK